LYLPKYKVTCVTGFPVNTGFPVSRIITFSAILVAPHTVNLSAKAANSIQTHTVVQGMISCKL